MCSLGDIVVVRHIANTPDAFPASELCYAASPLEAGEEFPPISALELIDCFNLVSCTTKKGFNKTGQRSKRIFNVSCPVKANTCKQLP